MKRITIARMGLGLAGVLSLGVLGCDVEQPEAGVQEDTEFRSISGDTVFNVMAAPYNATGNCLDDDSQQIQAAIDAAELVSGSVFFPEPSGGCYLLDGTNNSTIAAPVSLLLDAKVSLWSESKAEIHQADDVAAIEIRADDISVRNIRLTGPGFASADADSIGIDAQGTTARIERIRIDDVEIEDFKGSGVQIKDVDNFEIRSSSIKDVYTAGIQLVSSSDGRVTKNWISNIEGSSDPGGGIVLDRGSGTETADPRTSDLIIDSNIIRDADSNGIFAEGAERIAITGNQVTDSDAGIFLRDSSATGGSLACKDVTVGANVITSPGASSTSEGVYILGSSNEDASGISVTNNVIEGYGVDAADVKSGAVRLVRTQGALVVGNSIHDPVASGINVYQHNHDFLLAGNTILDPSAVATTSTPAIYVRDSNNDGQIGDNVLRSGWTGLRVNDNSNEVDLGTNRVSGNPSSWDVLIMGSADAGTAYEAHDVVFGQGTVDPSILLDGSTGSASIYVGDDPDNVSSPSKGDLYLCTGDSTSCGSSSQLYSYDTGWNGL